MRKLLVMMLFLVLTLTACAKVSYDAKLFDMANDWIDIDWLRDNLTLGTDIFFNGTAWEDVPNSDTLPDERVHIITDLASFDAIFIWFPPGVDFDSQMLVIYITTNIYMGTDYNLRNLSISDGVLSMQFRRQRSWNFGKSASSPLQRVFVVKMDQQNVTAVDVTISQ